MFLEKKQDIFWTVLRVSDCVVNVRRTSDLLGWNLSELLMLFMDVTNTMLTSLDLCELLDKLLAIGADIPRFR